MEDETKGGRLRPSSPERTPPEDAGTSVAPPRGPSYRIVFALFWVAVQAVLVVTAGRRSDGAFGFRMFSESSTLEVALFREIDAPDGQRMRVHVDDGAWTARASDGTHHRLTWYDRVPSPYWVFDREMHASYGAAAQLERLQGALDDVVAHLAATDDGETRRLLLEVKVRHNGREPVTHRLTSRERAISYDGGP